jgi:hypothetical protein
MFASIHVIQAGVSPENLSKEAGKLLEFEFYLLRVKMHLSEHWREGMR